MSKDDLPEQKLRRYGPASYRAAVGTATGAGAFCLIVLGALVINHIRMSSGDLVVQDTPLTESERQRLEDGEELPPSRALAVLKARLESNPGDEKLVESVRSMDVELRRVQALRVARARRGGYLLACGLGVLLLALHYAISYRKRASGPATKGKRDNEAARAAMFARWSVGAAALALMGAGLAVIAASAPGPAFDETGPGREKPPLSRATPTPTIVLQAIGPAKHWPRFRGRGGLGISASTDVPAHWDGTTGQGILWKKPVPLPGENSPIVWANRVFLSGADKEHREVYCFDARSGKLLWRTPVKDVPDSPKEPPEVSDMTGYAAPTMATDGARVYAMFGNSDVVSLDFAGKVVWSLNLDEPNNMYGHAASLTTYQGLLIIQFDRGGFAEDDLSRVVALEGDSGSVAWETDKRPVPNSWSSPVLVKVNGGDQLITCGTPWVISYDPATGEEIWKVKCLEGDIGPSPVWTGELVIVCNDGAALVGIRPNGRGDVTTSHVAFRIEETMPDTSSPLATGDLVFVAGGPYVNCYSIQAKKMLWEQRFDGTFNSSASLVGNRVYLMDDRGVMHIFRAAGAYEKLGTAKLGEESNCSPAFVDGRIYIRGKKHLFCIGKSDGG